MKKNTKIIVLFFAFILIFTASFLLWKSSVSPENKEIIDTLEVIYKEQFDTILLKDEVPIESVFPAVGVNSASSNADYIISATVSELKNTNSNKEGYLEVNEVLKGNIEVNQILLEIRAREPKLKEGDEYILFINHFEENNTDYYYLMREGYLIKNGSVYKGMYKVTITYTELKVRLFFITVYNDEIFPIIKSLLKSLFSIYQNYA